jgi:hypothetical protein
MLFAIRELHLSNQIAIWETPLSLILLLYRQHLENEGGSVGIDITTKDMIDAGLYGTRTCSKN